VPVDVLKYLAFVVLVPLAVAAGVYFSADHWMFLLSSSWENLDTATKREMLKVAPTALAGMFGSIIAAVTAVVVVALQRSANLQVETRKGEILDELEDKKNILAGQLDKKRQELQQQLALERDQIDDKLSRLNEGRAAVSEYRYLLQTVRLTGYKETEAIEPFQKKLIELRDGFTQFPALYDCWAKFHQKGHYLCERMQPLKSAVRRREVWIEKSSESNLSLGVEFGNSAQEVLDRLGEARAQVLTVPKTQQQPAGRSP
jgi:hypothetical protein